MKLGAALVPLGVAIIAAGCGGSSGSHKSKGAVGGAVVKTITIHEKEFSLTPSSITVSTAGTYVFKAVNDGSVNHALEIEGHGVKQRTAEIFPRNSADLKVTLSKPGKYALYCPIDGHRQQGMQATLTFGSRTGTTPGTTTTGGTSTSGYGY
jgi:uncharacterized cupredoxin-like copper-binding protein